MSSAFGGMHDDDEVEASSSDRHGWGTQRREPCVCSIWASKSGLLTCGSVYVLRVCQQPERARLSSYKEENETIDRRPVDPPPVVELQTYNNDISELLESTAFFVRVSIVNTNPEQLTDSYANYQYSPVKTPNGSEAATGEVISTPEKLKKLDGRPGALCIFAKLSVRVPGVFRLKFTVFETSELGIAELADTVSDPFEVFSPKLFRGMKASTQLTRHLAAQGIKVKLRTDTSAGRQSDSRRRPGPALTPASASPTHSASGHDFASPSPPPMRAPISQLSPLAQAVPPRRQSLVWRPNQNTSYTGPAEKNSRPASSSAMSPELHKRLRYGDDGMIPAMRDVSSRYDFYPVPPASDLLAFSLANDGAAGGPFNRTQANSGNQQYSMVSGSSSPPSGNRSLFALSTPLSLQARTSSARSEILGAAPLFTRHDLGTGDDGLGPLPSSAMLVWNFVLLPPPRFSDRRAPAVPPIMSENPWSPSHFPPIRPVFDGRDQDDQD